MWDPKLVLVAAVAVGLWVPLAHLQWFNGHEQISYVLRTVEWATELRAGHFYPRWCPDFYGGYGSPLFIFYGPVIYAIAGLLTATFLDPFWALKLVVLLGSIGSGVGTYALVYGETRRSDAALLGAIAYLAAPYRIGNLYDRGDIGEFSCIAVLPIVLWLYREAAREPLPSRARGLMAGAAVSHAVMIMTHPVLGLWGTLVVGLVVAASVIALFLRGLRRRAGLLVVAIACAPGLAGLYIVPALVYKGSTHTAAMVRGFYDPQHQWITVQTLFEKSIPLFLRNFLQIGPLAALAVLAFAVGLLFNFRKARAALGWLVLTLMLLGLTLPQADWFWARGRVPLAEFIQFPWRLLGPAALTASVVIGIGMAAACERVAERTRSMLAIVLSAALLFLMAWPYVSAGEMPTAGVPTDPDSMRQGMYSATDANEYLPITAHAPPRKPRRDVVEVTDGAVVDSSRSEGSNHMLALRAEKADAIVNLGLHAFPGWHVSTVSGPPGAVLNDEAGRLQLRLPEPGDYRLKVFFGASPAVRVGLLLSAISALGLGLFLAYGTRFWPSRALVTGRLRSAT